MRPALLRLLKRPSSVSILQSLALTPTGIEQLDYTHRCLRCQSRANSQQPAQVDHAGSHNGGVRRSKNYPTHRTRPPMSFPVHEIEPTGEIENAVPTFHTDNLEASKYTTKDLGLRPEALEFESDIGHTNDLGTRLVDQPENRNNFDLWEELLRFRQRRYGDKGTVDIWEALTVRVDGVCLPVTGPRADFFWKSFVDLGLKRELLLKEVVSYAVSLCEREGDCWSQLYERVVGGLLDRGMSNQAVEYHRQLQNTHFRNPDDLLKILPLALSPSSSARTLPITLNGFQEETPSHPGIKAFNDMCRTTDGHSIWSPVITTFLRHGYGTEAFKMHDFLVQRGDHPRSLEEMQPLLNWAYHISKKRAYKRLQEYADQRFLAETSAEGSEENAENIPEEKPLKDDMGARLFATQALNIETIIAGLKMFGVSAIGPRTLREMAARAKDSHDILEKLKKLKQSGISVGNSVFSQLIQKLAAQNRSILLSDLLSSDQHPDAVEDARVQESLLVSYYIAKDSRQYNLSLAILTEILPDGQSLYDVHFRKHVAAAEWRTASKIVDEMTLCGKIMSQDSMEFMVQQALTPRRVGHRPPTRPGISDRDEVLFVFKILQRVVPAGTNVSSSIWVELLKRLGMGHYWSELQECCRWLARQYGPHAERYQQLWANRSPSRPASLRPKYGGDQLMLDLIFSPKMQYAIVEWGFQQRIHPETNPQQLVPWVRGILLLRELEQAGVRLREAWIRRACRSRLAVLFNQPGLSARRLNRRVRESNLWSPERLILDIFRAWGKSSLFGGLESRPELLAYPHRSPLSLRRTARVKWRGPYVRRKYTTF
ncbi:hypothetical protein N7474_001256 [Penicillium riverlandense]|uniref:uncharacterized protein n=1 Tax=Penicillium riverlandense TaxID=1903569 RepID=UPI0025478E17|nr:uncharacterized protein N7474_001256 [Penicillium riverlandense]KAJ5832945.1 hypothetical protein N7474_001256 [Penicillium riverlandense]